METRISIVMSNNDCVFLVVQTGMLMQIFFLAHTQRWVDTHIYRHIGKMIKDSNVANRVQVVRQNLQMMFGR